MLHPHGAIYRELPVKRSQVNNMKSACYVYGRYTEVDDSQLQSLQQLVSLWLLSARAQNSAL